MLVPPKGGLPWPHCPLNLTNQCDPQFSLKCRNLKIQSLKIQSLKIQNQRQNPTSMGNYLIFSKYLPKICSGVNNCQPFLGQSENAVVFDRQSLVNRPQVHARDQLFSRLAADFARIVHMHLPFDYQNRRQPMIVQYPFTEHVEILFPLAHLCSVKQKEPRRLPSACSTGTFRDEAGGVRRRKKGKEMAVLFKGMIVEHLLQRLVCPLGEFGFGKVKRRSEILRKMEALLRIGTTRQSFFYRLKSRQLRLLSSSSFQCRNASPIKQVSSHSHLPQRGPNSRGQIKSKALLEAPSEVVDTLLGIMESHGSARGINALTNKKLPVSLRLLTGSCSKNAQKPQAEQEVNSQSQNSNCSPSRISISSSKVLRNIEANKENTPSEALKIKNNKSVKFLEEPKRTPLDTLKVGLRCLSVTVKAKVAKMTFQAFTQLKFYDIVNIEPEEHHREIEHSLALLNENLEKQEQIMELHQELEMKCQEIETMEEEITVFKRVLKLSVFKNIEHSLKKYTMEAFSRIALAGSFQLLRRGKPMDQSSTILQAQGESETESELSKEEPKPQVFYKPKTLIYIDDGILSSNSFSEPSQKTFGDLDDSALQQFAGQYLQSSLAKIEDN